MARTTPTRWPRGRNSRTGPGCAGAPAAARDQFAALLPVYERVLGPEHAETLAVWYQLAHWTALAGDEPSRLAQD